MLFRTQNELELVAILECEGKRDREIAEQLQKSVRTINRYKAYPEYKKIREEKRKLYVEKMNAALGSNIEKIFNRPISENKQNIFKTGNRFIGEDNNKEKSKKLSKKEIKRQELIKHNPYAQEALRVLREKFKEEIVQDESGEFIRRKIVPEEIVSVESVETERKDTDIDKDENNSVLEHILNATL